MLGASLNSVFPNCARAYVRGLFRLTYYSYGLFLYESKLLANLIAKRSYYK